MDNVNLVGRRLGKYEIHAELGQGGMGAVYKAYDPILDSWVAIKVLAPFLLSEASFVERFVREARAARKLSHPGIVTIYDVGQEAGWHYMVMEYLEGETLQGHIQRRGPLSLDEVVRVLRPLAESLDYAHRIGMVHRDIKPGNVIVNPTSGRVTLTDFGIVRAAESKQLTMTGSIIGTPKYMSPEQARGGKVGPQSDQYSLGVVAYEMLSGQAPFDADSTLGLLYKVVNEPPPPIQQVRPDLPPAAQQVLERVLAKEPGARFSSCSEMVDALAQSGTQSAFSSPSDKPLSATVLVTRGPVPDAAALPQAAPAPAPEPAAPPKATPAPVPKPVTPPPARPAPSPPVPAPHPVPQGGPAARPPVAAARPPAKSRRGPRRAVPGWIWVPGALAGLVVLGLALTGLLWLAGIGPFGQDGDVLFSSDRDGKPELYRLSADGAAERITHTPGNGMSWFPARAPDGSILFTSDRDGKPELYRLTTDGEVQRVTHTPGNRGSWAPALAPDGAVLFTSDRDGKPELYRLTTDGEVQRVTHTVGGEGSWSPAPVPDGSILFTSDRDGKTEVYRLTADGEVERITHTPGDGVSWFPVPARNGSILFVSNRDGKPELYRLTTDGEVERITHTLGDGVSWAPVPMADGTVLFTSDRDGRPELYRLTTDGEVERVTYTPDGASWSVMTEPSPVW